MKLALALMTKNESTRISECLRYYTELCKQDIFVFDDNSDDDTVIQIMDFSEIKLEIFPLGLNACQRRNHIMTILKKKGYTHVLFVDTDEEFDRYFLRNIERIVSSFEDMVSFGFPRCNLPDGKSYPDVQIRLIKLSDNIHFERPVHEVPYIDLGRDGKVLLFLYSKTFLCPDFPILHHRRLEQMNRAWW